METGDLPLEKMLGHYEEGVRLSQICQGKLAEAESKIEELEKNAAGDISLKRMSSQGEDNE